MAESLIEDLSLSYSQSGLLMSSFAIAYASMQIPSGVSSDRWGGRKVLLVALFILGVSSLMFCFLDRFETALIIRIIMGASAGLVLPASVKLISSWHEPHELEKAMGILGLGQGVGLIMSFVVIPAMMTIFNYRGGAVFTALFSLAIAALGFFELREPVNKGPANHYPYRQIFSKYGFGRILNKEMVFLILINFSGAATLFGVLTWAPIYLSNILKGPFVYVGFITAIAGLTNLIGSYSGALCAKILGSKKTIVTSMILCVILPFMITYVYQVISLIIIIALLGWVTMLYFAPFWVLVSSSVDKNCEGGAFSVVNALSFLGAFFAPLVVGYTLDVTGCYTIGFILISFMGILGLVASLLLTEQRIHGEHASILD